MILNYEKPSVKKWMALEADQAIAVFGMPWDWLSGNVDPRTTFSSVSSPSLNRIRPIWIVTSLTLSFFGFFPQIWIFVLHFCSLYSSNVRAEKGSILDDWAASSTLRVGLSSFVPFVNPQREQNILLLRPWLHETGTTSYRSPYRCLFLFT